MELIAQQIELKEIEENDFDIFFNSDTNRFHAFENNVPTENIRELIFELADTEENISKNHREEILTYCLSKVTKDDVVSLRDIFLHGKYIRQIKFVNRLNAIQALKEKFFNSDFSRENDINFSNYYAEYILENKNIKVILV